MIRILVLFFIMLTASCQQDVKQEIDRLLKSDKPENLVKAFYLIGENRDTTFVKEIIKNPYDQRIAHSLRFKGISVYQSKMIALKKISNENPPRQITYRPDSTIVDFYCRWINKNTKVTCK